MFLYGECSEHRFERGEVRQLYGEHVPVALDVEIRRPCSRKALASCVLKGLKKIINGIGKHTIVVRRDGTYRYKPKCIG